MLKIAYKLRLVPLILGPIIVFCGKFSMNFIHIPEYESDKLIEYMEAFALYYHRQRISGIWMAVGFLVLFAGFVFYFVVTQKYQKEKPHQRSKE